MPAAQRRPPNSVQQRRHSRRHSLPTRLASGPLFQILPFSPFLTILLSNQSSPSRGFWSPSTNKMVNWFSTMAPAPSTSLSLATSVSALGASVFALIFSVLFFFCCLLSWFLSLVAFSLFVLYRDVCDGCWRFCRPDEWTAHYCGEIQISSSLPFCFLAFSSMMTLLFLTYREELISPDFCFLVKREWSK